MPHLLLIPSLTCPAACAYCFGPRGDGATMPMAVVERAAAWVGSFPPGEVVEITFHGGEPLSAGKTFYRVALPLLRGARAKSELRVSIQSNLWGLDEEFAALLAEHGVRIGTSLDGPEGINDRQRGRGYFRRTMRGIATARQCGLAVGCIATLTCASAGELPAILDFFRSERMQVSIHAALPVLGGSEPLDWVLDPDVFGDALLSCLDALEQTAPEDGWSVEPVRSICAGLAAGQGGPCTFGGCLGKHLAVGPDGAIYPCQRFAGRPDFQMGMVGAGGGLGQVRESSVWKRLDDHALVVQEDCGACEFFSYCRGGCAYNALSAGWGKRDPYCPAYQRLFRAVVERASAEVFSAENLAAVVEQVDKRRGLLREGRLIRWMRGRSA